MKIRKGHELADYTKLVNRDMLEVIKTELENKRYYYKRRCDGEILKGIDIAMDIIKSHIEELER